MYKKFTKPKILGRIYSLSGPEPPKTHRTDIRPHRTATPSAHGSAPSGPSLPCQALLGTTRHNPTQPGTTRHNPARPNTTQHNPTQPGTTQHNPARPGTTRHDSALLSTAQHCSAQPGTTRHNSARPTRPGTARTTQHNSAHPTRPVTARDGRRHGFSAPWRCPPAPSARRCWPPGPSPPNGNGQAASRRSSRPPRRFARARCG